MFGQACVSHRSIIINHHRLCTRFVLQRLAGTRVPTLGWFTTAPTVNQSCPAPPFAKLPSLSTHLDAVRCPNPRAGCLFHCTLATSSEGSQPVRWGNCATPRQQTPQHHVSVTSVVEGIEPGMTKQGASSSSCCIWAGGGVVHRPADCSVSAAVMPCSNAYRWDHMHYQKTSTPLAL